jgi:hypothetical protein
MEEFIQSVKENGLEYTPIFLPTHLLYLIEEN